jgi:hypothetical protein
MPNPRIQNKTQENKKGILPLCDIKHTVIFISELNQTKGNEALHDISQFVVYDITLKLPLKTLTSLFSLLGFRGPSRSLYFSCRESTGKGTVMARCRLSKSYFVSAWSFKMETRKVDELRKMLLPVP